jgi:hypothetical protein
MVNSFLPLVTAGHNLDRTMEREIQRRSLIAMAEILVQPKTKPYSETRYCFFLYDKTWVSAAPSSTTEIQLLASTECTEKTIVYNRMVN